MKIYNYSPDTGEFIGSSEARIDPLETIKQKTDIFLIPNFSTRIEPPAADQNSIAVYENGWVIKTDLRGKAYWLPDGTKYLIQKIGEEFPQGALDTKPIIPPTKEELLLEQRLMDIDDNLPSWATVNDEISSISNMEDAKAVLRKIARVVYWMAKNSDS